MVMFGYFIFEASYLAVVPLFNVLGLSGCRH